MEPREKNLRARGIWDMKKDLLARGCPRMHWVFEDAAAYQGGCGWKHSTGASDSIRMPCHVASCQPCCRTSCNLCTPNLEPPHPTPYRRSSGTVAGAHTV